MAAGVIVGPVGATNAHHLKVNNMKNQKNTKTTTAAKAAVKTTAKVSKKATKQTDALIAVKAAKPVPTLEKPMTVRVYERGAIYFPKAASARIAEAQYLALTIKGKSITMQPADINTGERITYNGQAAVLRVKSLLSQTGWNGATQDCVVTPVGKAGVQITLA